MKWVSLFICLWLLFLPDMARAEISMEERMADCWDVRVPAQARSVWENIPCQEDGSCAPFDQSFYTGTAEAACVDEFAAICAAKPGAMQAQCFQRGVAFLEERISKIDLGELSRSLQSIAEQSTGFLRRNALRQLEGLTDDAPLSCPDELASSYPFSQASPEVTCSIWELLRTLSSLGASEAFVHRQGAK